MTKVGENDAPKPKIQSSYHKDLDANVLKFANALSIYFSSNTFDDKERLKGVMNQQLQLIQSSINEIKTKEIYKQGQKLAKDYDQYIDDGSEENFAALEQDLQTLREYNNIPDPATEPKK